MFTFFLIFSFRPFYVEQGLEFNRSTNSPYIPFTDSPLGDIVNWNEADWELSNVKRIELDTSDFCIDFPNKNYFMFPERRSLESGFEVCHKLGGSVSNPLDKTENDLLTQLGDKFYDVCEADAQSGKTLWIGIQRDSSEKWAVCKKVI